MKIAHLFAGIGGGLYADLILGHDPVVAVEIDAYCCQVLRERKADGTFPNLRVIHADVRGVDFARELAGVDAICAGFPCQDLSVAGKVAGINGERSGLWREAIRAVDAVRPAWVFLENSPNIRTRGRHVVIGELVARGYSWRDGRLAASDVGAPHRRMRWWCLARRSDTDCNGVPEQCTGEGAGSGCRASEEGNETDGVGQDVADASGQSSGVSRGGVDCQRRWSNFAAGRQDVSNSAGVRLEESQPCETGREQSAIAGSGLGGGIEAPRGGWWQSEPGMGRLADGVPCRCYRIKGLGNAQVPLQAAVAWRALGGP